MLSTKWNPFVLSCFIVESGRQGEDAEGQTQSVRTRRSPGLLRDVREGRLSTRSDDRGPCTPPTLYIENVGYRSPPRRPRQTVRGSFPPFNSPPPRTARYALSSVISERGHHEIHDGLVCGDVHHLVDDAPSRLPPPQPSLVDMAVTDDQYLCTGRATPKGDPQVRPP